jgi:hypothetical protein
VQKLKQAKTVLPRTFLDASTAADGVFTGLICLKSTPHKPVAAMKEQTN